MILATSSIRRLAENVLAIETSRGTLVLSAETRQALAGRMVHEHRVVAIRRLFREQ
ncbi:hypothetical protein HDG41_000745 [Paraburkholderia sp. JPY162]|uniref:Uncharacterized protein n=1 Tax=Paraburkholderia youngii TaxID=2782701 RepID=A0A7W8L475_9BURK|nr:hypothetical protein [Paraburkholderia youngii]MBB5398709.1 hypothetical protein [Paraburkholderia youngii]